MNISFAYLSICSLGMSPLLAPTHITTSIAVDKTTFRYFFSHLIRSTNSRARFKLKDSKISHFLNTPIFFSREVSKIENESLSLQLNFSNETFDSVLIIGCTFENVLSDSRGGCVYYGRESNLTIFNSNFVNCVSKYEAAILFVLVGTAWSISPVNVFSCTFQNCYSTGENFQIIDEWAEMYPSVLIHDFVGFDGVTCIPSTIHDCSALDCQENLESKKRFGALIHHHANTFEIKNFNASNHNKIDSSQIIFSQAHKQASKVMNVLAVGQTAFNFIEVKDLQSSDQLSFQNLMIANSTLLTDSTVNHCVFMFGGQYSGSIVFIYCYFYNVITDNSSITPVLTYSSNGRYPTFANCYTDSEYLAENNQGVTMTIVPTYQPPTSEIFYSFTETFSKEVAESSSVLTVSLVSYPVSPTKLQPAHKKTISNEAVVGISLSLNFLVAIIVIAVARRYLKKYFLDENNNSSDGNSSSSTSQLESDYEMIDLDSRL
ncbi:hypothetical protein TRFO_12184 [Tritrichomonas foetus]|uniref:Right handed beta helix domain-containing protein n=1 Tax=Tritrichomonas foetus TaxID=1144522 RepID=A0A1J4J719_9EUKA|nr:hypothetical protein TRFO_12184 [Tritrichomonas foetus]|eukprot:OHS92988.1 hypothetical protein TRFO_12184 [Tritrichomonas foetus]